MLLEVSTGEAVDKYSILEIKSTRITDERKHKEVQLEIEKLCAVRDVIDAHPFLYSVLLETNRSIWDLTDTMKGLSSADPRYAAISQQIFDENQKRFRIKNMLNYFTSSDLKEQKSYRESDVTICVTDLKLAIPIIWDLAFSYDNVSITGNYTNILRDMFRTPNFNFIPNKNAVLDTAFPKGSFNRHNPPPIRYASGGRLGDFIHQLSVVYEKFLQTGRPGILYVGEGDVAGDKFSKGVQKTIDDISPILMNLPYIHSIERYVGQEHDINLSWWRFRTDVFERSWTELFSEIYNVKWADHAWLTSPIQEDLAHVTLIHTTPTRWTNDVRWSEYMKTLPGKVMFLRISDGEYEHFCQKTGTHIPCVDAKSFTEIVVAIHSCLKFVGTLSMPLAVADALKKDRIAVTQAGSMDENLAVRTDPRHINRF